MKQIEKIQYSIEENEGLEDVWLNGYYSMRMTEKNGYVQCEKEGNVLLIDNYNWGVCIINIGTRLSIVRRNKNIF